jgi:hypothetical protein
MRLFWYDYETFWDRKTKHSLTHVHPVEYVMTPKTEIQVLTGCFDNGPIITVIGENKIREFFDSQRWDDTFMVAHNGNLFDHMITAWRFGIKPAMWGDTLAMGAPIFGMTAGGSLKKMAEALNVGKKGSLEATQTEGLYVKDWTPDMLDAIQTYAGQDTLLCRAIFRKLYPQTSMRELRLIDLTCRMLVNPGFDCDLPALKQALIEEQERKLNALKSIANVMGVTDIDVMQKSLMSNPMFADLLARFEVNCPKKISPTTGREALALAKTDQAFLDLLEHDNPIIAAAAQARLGAKSTILESRIKTFITMAEQHPANKMPIALNYWGASTGRWSGAMKANQQNLPRIPRDKTGQIIDKPTNILRLSLVAPRGHKVVVADLSGIELRVNHTLWKVADSMALYAEDPEADLYKSFAAKLYNKPKADVTKDERQFAKLCVAEGTLVLTDKGEIPIEQVTIGHRVWDGIEFVDTSGPVYRGEKDVIEYDGLIATPDHEVWVEDGRKLQIGDAASQVLRLAISGVGGAPIRFSRDCVQGVSEGERIPNPTHAMHPVWGGEADQLRQPEGGQDQGMPIVQPEMRSPRVVAAEDGIGATALHQPEGQSIPPIRGESNRVSVPNSEGRGSLDNGEPGAGARLGDRPDQQRNGALRAGEPSIHQRQNPNSQPSSVCDSELPPVQEKTPRDTLRGHHSAEPVEQRHDSRPDSREVLPEVRQTKRRVWDLLNCGPRNRFTANGKLVSNCQLGLGYGMSAGKFRLTAHQQGVILSQEEADHAVATWREFYFDIVQGWNRCGDAIKCMARGTYLEIDPWGHCKTDKETIHTPHSCLRYPDLRQEKDEETGKSNWVYGQGRNKRKIYGALGVENLVQHLARTILSEQMLAISKELPVSLSVHDEVVCVVPEHKAKDALQFMLDTMKTSPQWWPEIVLWAEGDIADSYGQAK